MEISKEEILAKRIITFPSEGDMTDEAIKRNVYAAMEEYANSKLHLLQQEYDRAIQFSEQQAVKIHEMRQRYDNLQEKYAILLQLKH